MKIVDLISCSFIEAISLILVLSIPFLIECSEPNINLRFSCSNNIVVYWHEFLMPFDFKSI